MQPIKQLAKAKFRNALKVVKDYIESKPKP